MFFSFVLIFIAAIDIDNTLCFVCQDYGGEKLKLGTAFAHFGIATQDVSKTKTEVERSELAKCQSIQILKLSDLCYPQAYKMVEEIRARGGVITREAGPIEGGTTVFAFIQDPDGYMFELIQRPPTPEPLCQLMLHVSDLDRAIQFYEKVDHLACILNI